jgi:hypothetical protein
MAIDPKYADKPAGWGVLKPGASASPTPFSPAWLAAQSWNQKAATYNKDDGSASDLNTGGGDTGGGGGGPTAEQVAARAAAAARAKQNQATKDLVAGQLDILKGFDTQRDSKLKNILTAFNDANSALLEGYGVSLKSLMENASNNDKSESDASYDNVANAVRERQDILAEAASQGAGESDLLKAQIQALRNLNSNQGEVTRSYHDTQNSINSAITGLNKDTQNSRANLFNQREADRESAWANYYNQRTDTLTQIANIEAQNTNEDYQKQVADASQQAAKATSSAYEREKANSKELASWSGKGEGEKRSTTASNRAASVNLGKKQKAPEGATLRNWN